MLREDIEVICWRIANELPLTGTVIEGNVDDFKNLLLDTTNLAMLGDYHGKPFNNSVTEQHFSLFRPAAMNDEQGGNDYT